MTRRPTTYLIPGPGHDACPCCGKSPLKLPIGDRLALDMARVTCGEGE